MWDVGWGMISLYDATFDASSRLAARCFLSMFVVVVLVGGFNGKIWVLSFGVGGVLSVMGCVMMGFSDGYWRAYVVLVRDAGLYGKVVGLCLGDEMCVFEVGFVYVVNDYYLSVFWNVFRDVGVVLFSFDVARLEFDFCRAVFVELCVRFICVFGVMLEEYNGDVIFMVYLWCVFLFILISNFS